MEISTLEEVVAFKEDFDEANERTETTGRVKWLRVTKEEVKRAAKRTMVTQMKEAACMIHKIV